MNFAKISILVIIACISVVKGFNGIEPPHPPVNNGNYFIINVADNLNVGAYDNGCCDDRWTNTGPVTTVAGSNTDGAQIWFLSVYPHYPEHGITSYYQLSSRGPNNFNYLSIELPKPGAYPVQARWELIDGGNDNWLLRRALRFDWTNEGDDKCLVSNGEGQNATTALCNKEDPRQLWKLQFIGA